MRQRHLLVFATVVIGVLKPLVDSQPPFDGVDLILATHEHADHFSPDLWLDVAFVPHFMLTEAESHAHAVEGIQARYLIPIHFSPQALPVGIEDNSPNAGMGNYFDSPLLDLDTSTVILSNSDHDCLAVDEFIKDTLVTSMGVLHEVCGECLPIFIVILSLANHIP
jgi:hypothetical protein